MKRIDGVENLQNIFNRKIIDNKKEGFKKLLENNLLLSGREYVAASVGHNVGKTIKDFASWQEYKESGCSSVAVVERMANEELKVQRSYVLYAEHLPEEERKGFYDKFRFGLYDKTYSLEKIYKITTKLENENTRLAFTKLKENASQQRSLKIEAAAEQSKNNLTDEYKQNINKIYNKYKSGSSMFKFNPVSPRTNLINLQQKAGPLINRLESQQARDRAYSPSNAGLSWDNFNTKLQDDWNKTLAQLNEVSDDTQKAMQDADDFGYDSDELGIIKPPAQGLIDRFNELQRQGVSAETKAGEWRAKVEDTKDFVNNFEKAYNDNNRVLFNKYKKQAVDITNNIMAFTQSLKAIDGITPNEKREVFGYAKKIEELYKKELVKEQYKEEEKKMEPVRQPVVNKNILEKLEELEQVRIQQYRNISNFSQDQILRQGTSSPFEPINAHNHSFYKMRNLAKQLGITEQSFNSAPYHANLFVWVKNQIEK